MLDNPKHYFAKMWNLKITVCRLLSLFSLGMICVLYNRLFSSTLLATAVLQICLHCLVRNFSDSSCTACYIFRYCINSYSLSLGNDWNADVTVSSISDVLVSRKFYKEVLVNLQGNSCKFKILKYFKYWHFYNWNSYISSLIFFESVRFCAVASFSMPIQGWNLFLSLEIFGRHSLFSMSVFNFYRCF